MRLHSSERLRQKAVHAEQDQGLVSVEGAVDGQPQPTGGSGTTPEVTESGSPRNPKESSATPDRRSDRYAPRRIGRNTEVDPRLDLPLGAEHREKLLARLEKRSIPEPNTGCTLYFGASNPSGYGQIRVGWVVRQAHRVAYSLAFGRIPDTLHLDHKCMQRACINPLHLEPVTAKENNRRAMVAHGRLNLPGRTHCKHGHEIAVVGVYLMKRDGNLQRVCRACWAKIQARSLLKCGRIKTTKCVDGHVPLVTPSKSHTLRKARADLAVSP